MKINPEEIPAGIRDVRIGIIGYGLLGNPIAHCLRDSSHYVRIGLRDDSQSHDVAHKDGFEPGSIEDVSSWADALFLHVPDDVQAEVYNNIVNDSIKDGSILVLAHGYSLLYEKIKPKDTIDTVVIAPHGPGKALRQLFVTGKGIAAQLAIHHDSTGDAKDRALMLARSMGHHKGGIWITNAHDEVIMDHFSEQAVLCGGVVELMKAAYKTLVDKGYDPESSYESVVRELKYTVDLIYNSSPADLFRQISRSALLGSLLNSDDLLGYDIDDRMRRVLENIESGAFQQRFESITSGKEEFNVEGKIKDLDEFFGKGKS